MGSMSVHKEKLLLITNFLLEVCLSNNWTTLWGLWRADNEKWKICSVGLVWGSLQ